MSKLLDIKEIEMCLVGAWIATSDKDERGEALVKVSAGMFTDQRLRVLWEICSDLYAADSGKNYNLAHIDAALKRSGRYSEAGGLDFAATLAESVPNTLPSLYTDKVVDFYKRRRVLAAIDELRKTAETPDAKGLDADGLVNRLMTLLAQKAGTPLIDVIDLLDEAFRNADSEGPAVPVGMDKMDGSFSFFRPGEVTVLAGRPGSGKSSFMRQVVRACLGFGRRAVVYSMEITPVAMTQQFVCEGAGVPYASWRKNRLLAKDQVEASIASASLMPLTFWQRSSVTAMDVAVGVTQAMAKKEPLGLVAIDYLGLMKHPKADRDDLAIGATTSALKQLALEKKIPILLLHQLNRDSEKRGGAKENDRPRLADLRGSGNIEQDADNVVFVWQKERPGGKDVQRVEARTITVAKYRYGQVGEFDVMFDKAVGKFFDPEDMSQKIARPA